MLKKITSAIKKMKKIRIYALLMGTQNSTATI